MGKLAMITSRTNYWLNFSVTGSSWYLSSWNIFIILCCHCPLMYGKLVRTSTGNEIFAEVSKWMNFFWSLTILMKSAINWCFIWELFPPVLNVLIDMIWHFFYGFYLVVTGYFWWLYFVEYIRKMPVCCHSKNIGGLMASWQIGKHTVII